MAALHSGDRNGKWMGVKDNRCLYVHILVLYVITIILTSTFSVASWFYYQELTEVKFALNKCWINFNFSHFQSLDNDHTVEDSAFYAGINAVFRNSAAHLTYRSKRNVVSELDQKTLFWLSILKDNSLSLDSYCQRAKSYCSAEGRPGSPGRPGLIGTKGNRGLAGRVGKQGVPGKDVVLPRVSRGVKRSPNTIVGPPGPRGEQGKPGYPGEKGDKGESGFPGPRGPPGLAGQGGLDGLDGMPGPKGDKGEKGFRGLLGFPGGKGPVGPMGPPGAPGPMGHVGKDGLDGLPGVPGIHGRNGTDGIPGRRGKKGDSGTSGNPGQRGTSGVPGVPGFKGYKGDRGSKGWAGVDCLCETRRNTDSGSRPLDRYVQREQAEPEGEWAMCQVHCVDNSRRTRTAIGDVKADPIALRSEPSLANTVRPTPSAVSIMLMLAAWILKTNT